MENIKNRDFWSRRSRNNPFSRLRSSSRVRSYSGNYRSSLAGVGVGDRGSMRSFTGGVGVTGGGDAADQGNTRTKNQEEEEEKVEKRRRREEEEEKVEQEEEEKEEEEEALIASEMMLEAQRETLLRENVVWMRNYLTESSKTDGGNFTLTTFLNTMSNKELLNRLFSLWDVRGDGVLLQQEWVDHLKCSTRAVGAREWSELLEVLAYVVCGEEGVVTSQHFTKILTSRGVLEKLYRLVSKDGDGVVVTRQDIMDFIANLTYARPRTGFTRENLEWLEQLFRQALGLKQELSFDDFKKIVHSRNSFFAERVFQIFDRDNSGTVSLSEFLDAMHQFAGKSPNDKIKFLFRVYDLDGDGLIQQSELQKVMKACMEENGMKFSDDQIEDLTLAMFEDADTQNTGAITYESLKAQLEKHDGLLENLSISIDRWLVPPNIGKKAKTNTKLKTKVTNLRPYQMSLPYLKNNYVYLSFLIAYLAINLGLFVSRAWEYRESNGYTIVARACGQCLNFNCMFVLVLMLRQCITYLRSLGASSFLPLDQHMYLHKLCGWLIFGYSLLHSLMHLINFSVNIVNATGEGELNEDEWALWEWLFTMRPEKLGLIDGIANPTGIALIVILTLMVVCSLPFVRKSGYFEVFYWTHLLYIVFFTLTILHGPNFWKWFVAPGIIFLIERIHRTIRMRTGRGKTYISSGVLLPSKVIHLVIKRPANFQFHPGDYVFINIPEIAKYEWHPFTISSAPEQEDVLWLHIRAVGQWTNRLHGYFENEQLKCERQRCELQVSSCNSVRRSTITTTMALHSTTDLPHNTLVEDGRTAFLSSHHTGLPRLALENGISNAAFQPDTPLPPPPPHPTNSSSSHSASPQNNNKNKRRKEEEEERKENVLMSSDSTECDGKEHTHGVDDVDEMGVVVAGGVGGGDLTNTHTNFRKSDGMSFKYIRRKPTIICLDLPSETESLAGDYYDDEDDADGEEEGDKVVEGEGEEEVVRRGGGSGRGGKRMDVRVTIQDDLTDTHQPIRGDQNTSAVVLAEEGRVRRKSRVDEGCRRKSSRQEDRRRSRQEERRAARKRSRMEEVLAEGGCAVGKPLVIYMDGPFGAPSSHIFRAQHAVLIATGIGVTPFASILQSIMHKYWKARHTCPKCTHSWTSDLPHSVMNLRKVDFFWINRDQRSFEWFVNLLSQLEIEQAEQGGVLERFLDMHMYITSALQKTDMKAVGLQLALDLLHEKEKRDLITGLKTRTNAGRPNWDKVFKQLTNQQKGKITVFYCGPPALGRTLRYKCDEYGFDFRKEIF
ncbi:hypothetical protein Pmani_024320 [Petrolisthes manimaculis]|uniref:NADPH oxidase n=1 Tax=Petrolisthes manimaculis TaxID=1843537 RepID=A0AAE1U2G6_9EUCA|nr:hypothetical protein Pmani_024320 [Petrolisthes manimaculis]KAK4303694.1 hypothetical protein Pmani_024320 [Petrolisthes manimaculis]